MSRPSIQISKLLSNTYSNDNLPQDWADMTFLVPHESIRRQMKALVTSVEALPETITTTTTENNWRVTLLAKWFNDIFYFLITQHYDAIEQVYKPFLTEHGTQWPNLLDDSQTLIPMKDMLDPIQECCTSILTKDGIECTDSIVTMKELVPSFVQTLSGMLYRENGMKSLHHIALSHTTDACHFLFDIDNLDQMETKVPPIIRNSITEKQNASALSKMIAYQGIPGLMKILPGILLANQEWMTRNYYAQYLKTLPPPILKAQVTTLIPNYCHCYMRMRDAPLLRSRPLLKEVAIDDPSIPSAIMENKKGGRREKKENI